MNFEDIKGHENIKRAIEIAILGKHYLKIIPVRGHGATMLICAAEDIASTTNCDTPCHVHTDYAAEDCDIIMEMCPIDANTFFNGRKSESNSAVAKRIENAFTRNLKHTKLDDVCIALAKNAMDKLELTPKQMGFILSVSATIARLDGADTIQAHHVAEAILYQSYKQIT